MTDHNEWNPHGFASPAEKTHHSKGGRVKGPYRIGPHTFDTLSDIKALCKRIIRETPDMQRVAAEHQEFLKELLNWHQDSALKIGPGVDHFVVDQAPRGPTEPARYFSSRCLWVVRTDETREHVSYKHCVYRC